MHGKKYVLWIINYQPYKIFLIYRQLYIYSSVYVSACVCESIIIMFIAMYVYL